MTRGKFEDAWTWSSNVIGRKIDKHGALRNFKTAEKDKNGVLRWKTNNRIPPDHELSLWVKLGFISMKEAKIMNQISKKEDNLFFLKAYESMPEEWDANPEMLADARANADGNRFLVNPMGSSINLKTGKWTKHKKKRRSKKR